MFKKTCLIILALALVVSSVCLFTACNDKEEETATIDYYVITPFEVKEGDAYSFENVDIKMYLTDETNKSVKANLKYDTENIYRYNYDAEKGEFTTLDTSKKYTLADIVDDDDKYTTPYVSEGQKGKVKYRVGVKFLEEPMNGEDGKEVYLDLIVSPKR